MHIYCFSSSFRMRCPARAWAVVWGLPGCPARARAVVWGLPGPSPKRTFFLMLIGLLGQVCVM